MPREDWLIVGLSGATCSGKSSVASRLHSLFPDSVLLRQDDYFYDVESDKHERIPELDHINFEILSSIDMESFKNRIEMVLGSNGVDRHDSDSTKIRLEKQFKEVLSSSEPANECLLTKVVELKYVPHLLILDGFLLFNDDELRRLCDLKYYFTLNKATCWERRKNRVYEPADVPGYFEKYVWPTYLIHYEQVLKSADNVKFIDGADSIENNFRSVLHKLLTFLS